ncbi:MAG: hypothetical protein B1H13_11385 [Desulfobacteraceae bacterium 4484_190.3]|nr:MAG: hypothetical protein B1H13_11385 [Desulfobacteraceae bacterium 4484_190.3]
MATGTEANIVPDRELENRTKRVQKAVREMDIDALFLVQRVDFYYLTGIMQRGIFYLPGEGVPLLFLDGSPAFGGGRLGNCETFHIASLKEIPKVIRDYYGAMPRTVGFENDVLPVADFNFYRELFPGAECVDGSSCILDARKIKSEWELARMEESAGLTAQTFEYGKSVITPGMEEMAFAALLEGFARVRGRERENVRVRDYHTEGYEWHVLSGKSGGMVGLLDSPASGEGTSVAFPCGAGHKPIERNEPVMVDFSFLLNNYHMDETRMFSIGPMDDRTMKACEAAIAIHDAVLFCAGAQDRFPARIYRGCGKCFCGDGRRVSLYQQSPGRDLRMLSRAIIKFDVFEEIRHSGENPSSGVFKTIEHAGFRLPPE